MCNKPISARGKEEKSKGSVSGDTKCRGIKSRRYDVSRDY